jgi:hypothetical protein
LATFLDEIVSPFCVKLANAKAPLAFGQIFRVPAYYPHSLLYLWRPKSFDPKSGIASDFNPSAGPKDAFSRNNPYAAPPLQTTEEFLMIRAKKRPVILIQPPDPKLATIPKITGGGKLARNLAPIALIYSAADKAGIAKFDQAFLDRVRLLEYPQFLFIPSGGPLTIDSVARFDELQSVDISNLEPSGYSLGDDAIAVLKSQLSFFMTGLAGQSFQDWAAELHK